MYQLRRISAFQYLLSRNVILFFVSVVVSGSPVFTLIAFFTIVLKPFLVFGQIVPLSTRTSILICVCIRIYAYTRALLSVPSIFYLVLVLSEDNLICPITNLFGIVSQSYSSVDVIFNAEISTKFLKFGLSVSNI